MEGGPCYYPLECSLLLKEEIEVGASFSFSFALIAQSRRSKRENEQECFILRLCLCAEFLQPRSRRNAFDKRSTSLGYTYLLQSRKGRKQGLIRANKPRKIRKARSAAREQKRRRKRKDKNCGVVAK